MFSHFNARNSKCLFRAALCPSGRQKYNARLSNPGPKRKARGNQYKSTILHNTNQFSLEFAPRHLFASCIESDLPQDKPSGAYFSPIYSENRGDQKTGGAFHTYYEDYTCRPSTTPEKEKGSTGASSQIRLFLSEHCALRIGGVGVS